MKMIPIVKNHEYTADITAMSSDGSGIARIDGYTVFIPQAIAGDTVRFVALQTKASYGRGKLLKILTPSADRVVPCCPVSEECGGCQLMHMSYSAQLTFKEELVRSNLRRIGGFTNAPIEPIIGMDNPFAYRNKMVFPIGSADNRIISGFYAPRSHHLISFERCYLGSSNVASITSAVRKYMESCHISAYDEATHTGCIRRVFIREGRQTGQTMVVISANSETVPQRDALTDYIRTASKNVVSIIWNINTKRTSLALGSRNIILWGKDTIEEILCGIRYRISPHSFFQVNPVQTERLYQKAIDFAALTGSETVMDLYCGIGTISLACARYAKRVIGVEIVEQAITDAKRNAAENGIENADFYADSAEHIVPLLLSSGERPDIVILDPPRKGSDTVTLDAIAKAQPKRIVYVSCDSATLARDARQLAERGYEIRRAAPFDMFPQTAHVETVVLLSRKGENQI